MNELQQTEKLAQVAMDHPEHSGDPRVQSMAAIEKLSVKVDRLTELLTELREQNDPNDWWWNQ
ncbi:MAG: hypothetical protein KJN72_10675 [Woeseia sp.]|nr:hypothetical protein [Woeseia sp.]